MIGEATNPRRRQFSLRRTEPSGMRDTFMLITCSVFAAGLAGQSA